MSCFDLASWTLAKKNITYIFTAIKNENQSLSLQKVERVWQRAWGFEASLGFSSDGQCNSCFLFLFLLRWWQERIFFSFLAWEQKAVLWEVAAPYVQLMKDACGTLPVGSPGEKGDASCTFVKSRPRGPVFLEEYSCTGGVIKLLWCRGLRYFFPVLLKGNPRPSTIEVSHLGVTADRTVQSSQGTKWGIRSVIFNWQIWLLLWLSLMLLTQCNLTDWIGFFYLQLNYYSFKLQEEQDDWKSC